MALLRHVTGRKRMECVGDSGNDTLKGGAADNQNLQGSKSTAWSAR
jgi:hypothetical protein